MTSPTLRLTTMWKTSPPLIPIRTSLLALVVGVSMSACSSGSDSGPASESPIDSNTGVDQSANTATPPPSSLEGGEIGVFNPNATRDVFACEAPYYIGLRGLYLGTISYTAPNDTVESCTWDTALQVRGSYEDENDTSSCLVTATYTYTLIDGASNCVDGAVDGVMDDPLAASSNRVDWSDPQWPLDLAMRIDIEPAPASIENPNEIIFPVVSQSAIGLETQWSFDGLDETMLTDTDNSDGTVMGTLVDR